MKIFQCQNCDQPIFFENVLCESCGSSLGYLSERMVLSALRERKGVWEALADPKGGRYRYCQNHKRGACNWLVPEKSGQTFCVACDLNRMIPNLDDPGHLDAWQELERAKRRMVYSLLRLKLPLRSKKEDPETGLAFDFLSDDPADNRRESVVTGHSEGLVTINVAEADPAYRERMRKRMGESYRTLIGHFRHEVGHYYWERLVQPDRRTLEAFRSLFGDERKDYGQALQDYYDNGPPPNWNDNYQSAYAAMHPWEDWAESWAHYLHLVDTLETAYAFGLSLNPNIKDSESLGMKADFDPYKQPDFDAILNTSIPLAFAVNSLNRSMGLPDFYPFILPPPVVEKLRFIHRLIYSSTESRQGDR